MEEEMAIAAAAGSPPGYYDFVGSDLSVGKCYYMLGSDLSYPLSFAVKPGILPPYSSNLYTINSWAFILFYDLYFLMLTWAN